MSAESAKREPPLRLETGNRSRPVDRLAALINGIEWPAACFVNELLLAWRHAQQEATDAYAGWHGLAPRDGYTAYLAALDREERAAVVYAEVRRRAIERRALIGETDD